MVRHKLTILVLLILFAFILYIISMKMVEQSARNASRLQLDFAKECIAKGDILHHEFSWDRLSDRLDICVSNLKVTPNSGIVVISLHDMKIFWDQSITYRHLKSPPCIDGDINDKASYNKCDKSVYMIRKGYNGSTTIMNGNEKFWADWIILPTLGTTFDSVSRHDALSDNDTKDLNQIALIQNVNVDTYYQQFKIIRCLAFLILLIFIIYSVFVIFTNEYRRRINDFS